jgi:hypothetical protein
VLRRLHAEGATDRRLAEAMKCSARAASSRRRRLGLPANRGRRGFATLSPERRRKIASQGGKAAHAQGKAHEFTAEEALAAAKKGWAHRRRGV